MFHTFKAPRWMEIEFGVQAAGPSAWCDRSAAELILASFPPALCVCVCANQLGVCWCVCVSPVRDILLFCLLKLVELVCICGGGGADKVESGRLAC